MSPDSHCLLLGPCTHMDVKFGVVAVFVQWLTNKNHKWDCLHLDAQNNMKTDMALCMDVCLYAYVNEDFLCFKRLLIIPKSQIHFIAPLWNDSDIACCFWYHSVFDCTLLISFLEIPFLCFKSVSTWQIVLFSYKLERIIYMVNGPAIFSIVQHYLTFVVICFFFCLLKCCSEP